jgi:hypothetical protein
MNNDEIIEEFLSNDLFKSSSFLWEEDSHGFRIHSIYFDNVVKHTTPPSTYTNILVYVAHKDTPQDEIEENTKKKKPIIIPNNDPWDEEDEFEEEPYIYNNLVSYKYDLNKHALRGSKNCIYFVYGKHIAHSRILTEQLQSLYGNKKFMQNAKLVKKCECIYDLQHKFVNMANIITRYDNQKNLVTFTFDSSGYFKLTTENLKPTF